MNKYTKRKICAVLILIIILFGAIWSMSVITEAIDQRLAPYHTTCMECHDKCDKNINYSIKCRNCHEEDVCVKGIEYSNKIK